MFTNKVRNHSYEKSSSSSVKNNSPIDSFRENTVSALQMIKTLNMADDTKDDVTVNRSQTIVTPMNTAPDKSQFEGGENE